MKSKKKCERKTVDDFEEDCSVESGRNKAGRISQSMAKSIEKIIDTKRTTCTESRAALLTE